MEIRVIAAFLAPFVLIGIGTALIGGLKEYLEAWLIFLCVCAPIALTILIAAGVFF
jgi:hypothetical protein